MAEEIIKARVWTKIDTLDAWNASPLILGAGEFAPVLTAPGGSVFNFKVGTGDRRFSDLPWSLQTPGTAQEANTSTVFPPGTPGLYIPTESGTYNGITVDLSAGYTQLIWDGATLVKAEFPIDLAGYLKSDILSRGWAGGDQLFDKDNMTVDRYVNSPPAISTMSGASVGVVLFPEGLAESQITVSGLTRTSGRTKRYYWADKDNVPLSGSSPVLISPSGPTTVTIDRPQEGRYLYFTAVYPEDAPGTADAIMVNLGDSAMPFEGFTPATIGVDGIIPNADKAVYTQQETLGLLPQSNTTSIPGKNKANPTRITSGYVNSVPNTGLASNSNWRIVVIPCLPNRPYTISGWESSRSELAYYSGPVPPVGGKPENGAIPELISSGPTTKADGSITINTPNSCSYFIFTVRRDSENDNVFDELMVEEGATESAYQPYEEQQVVTGINGTAIAPEFITVGDRLVSTADIASGGGTKDAMTLKIDFSGQELTSIEYSYNGKQIRQEVAPFRPLVDITSRTAFDFRRFIVDNEVIQNTADDAAPYRVFNTTVGANHGYNRTRITASAHGKTNADVGSVYTDGTREFVIINIFSANQLDVSSRSDNAGVSSNLLTHVSGGTDTSSINSTSRVNEQFYPIIKNRKIEVLTDGHPIPSINNTYFANDTISFVESYDIMEKNSMMEWLISQVGTSSKIVQFDGDAAISVSINYVFDRNMGCTIFTDFVALKAIDAFKDIMFLQAVKLVADPVKYYVPKTLPFNHDGIPMDFSEPTDITSMPLVNSIDFTMDKCDPAGLLADRALMLTPSIGFAMGYLPVKDAALSRRRDVATRKALEIRNTKKVYMSAVDTADIAALTPGDYFSVIGYRNFFLRDPVRTSAYVVETPSGGYLYADYHAASVDRISLPSNFAGKSVQVIEKTNTISVLSEPTGSILLEASGKGYIILKFDE